MLRYKTELRSKEYKNRLLCIYAKTAVALARARVFSLCLRECECVLTLSICCQLGIYIQRLPKLLRFQSPLTFSGKSTNTLMFFTVIVF